MAEIATALSKANLRKVGRALLPVAEKAAKADLGMDGGFSGWRPGKVIRLRARAIVDSKGTSLTIRPTSSSAGQWRVADQGRNRGGGALLGPGIIRSGANAGTTGRTKAGNVRKVRAFKAKRWNGVTQGKNTWADAEALMEPVAVRELSALYTSTVVDEFVRPL